MVHQRATSQRYPSQRRPPQLNAPSVEGTSPPDNRRGSPPPRVLYCLAVPVLTQGATLPEHRTQRLEVPARCHRRSQRAALAFGLLLGACGADERPPHLSTTPGPPVKSTSTGPLGDDEPCEGPPPPDTAGYCGNQIVQVLTEKPNVYFVLDGSGSMQQVFEGSSDSKLLHAKFAIRDLLSEIGHRIRYGAAVFPDNGKDDDVCAAGDQVFPTTEGDSPLCTTDKYGPVLLRFLDSIGFREAEGGSPISATLATLAPTLTSLGPHTSVVLITDGAPNCNPSAVCDASGCIPNIERQLIGGQVCGEDVDCCDRAVLGPEARANCIDDDASQRVVADLFDEGVQTFVVGMPGSETYADVLDTMAEAGGTARSKGDTRYYSVRDTADLVESLLTIGTQVSLSCEITLENRPPDPALLNVYFDNDPVDFDAIDGWSYADDASIELNGEACDVLRSGAVNQLQVVAGCPTIIK